MARNARPHLEALVEPKTGQRDRRCQKNTPLFRKLARVFPESKRWNLAQAFFRQ